MEVHATILATYGRILEQVVLEDRPLASEQALADAFELGRALVGANTTPDEIANLHHEAMLRLGWAHPQLPLAQIADRSTLPLMELTMAHGMAFREQLEQRYRKLLTTRLEQSSRLEALGTLAAGIAHDFNNILGSILGHAEMTEDACAPGTPGREHMRQVQIACARARDLVARMLAFARQAPSRPVPLDLAEQVGEAVAMLAPTLGKGIHLEFINRLGPVQILADPGQIQQIILNLCINAAEAMAGRGHIHVCLEGASAQAEVPEGHAQDVCLSVADTGAGMPPEVQDRVFEPFFTTKAPRGSGLGLSVTHGIVQQLGGEISLSSRSTGPTTGTEVRIFLPPVRTSGASARKFEEIDHGPHTGH